MPCPGCQHENPQHAKVCLECGRPSKGTNQSGPPVPSYADLQHALSEALGQIQTRDRELVETQEQQTALGAVSGTPALKWSFGRDVHCLPNGALVQGPCLRDSRWLYFRRSRRRPYRLPFGW